MSPQTKHTSQFNFFEHSQPVSRLWEALGLDFCMFSNKITPNGQQPLLPKVFDLRLVWSQNYVGSASSQARCRMNALTGVLRSLKVLFDTCYKMLPNKLENRAPEPPGAWEASRRLQNNQIINFIFDRRWICEKWFFWFFHEAAGAFSGGFWGFEAVLTLKSASAWKMMQNGGVIMPRAFSWLENEQVLLFYI